MRFATEDPLTPRTILSRRDHLCDRLQAARAQLRQIDETGGAQPQRLKDSFVAEAIESITRKDFHRFAKQHETKIAIDALTAWRTHRFLAMDLFIDVTLRRPAGDEIDPSRLLASDDLFEKWLPRRQPRRVVQQMAESRQALAQNTVHRDDARDLIIQADFLFLHQQHDRHGGRQRFGQRRDIEDRLGLHWRFIRQQRAVAEGLLINHALVLTNDQDRARQDLMGNGLLKGVLDGMEIHERKFNRRFLTDDIRSYFEGGFNARSD